MKKMQSGKLFAVIIMVLAVSLTFNSTVVQASPAKAAEISVDVDLVQNGGVLIDRNARLNKNVEVNGTATFAALPQKYDLRDEGMVTDVKFQNPWGTCWAFGAVASIESSALMQGAKDPDYSEKNLIWTSKQAMKDEDDPEEYLEGPSIAGGNINESVYNMGGAATDVTGALMAWQGASTEDEVPYKNAEGTTEIIDFGNGKNIYYYKADGDWSVDSTHAFDDSYRLDQARTILGYSAYEISGISKERIESEILPSLNNQVKSWIMKNGAMSVGYCANESSPDDLGQSSSNEYYNPDTYAQYNPDSTSMNHMVTIVGWDDEFSKDNFAITPPGDGAWIIKNSWSDQWGDDGYFYLSYYDTTIYEYDGYLADQENESGYRNYDNNYQYDYMGIRSSINFSAENSFIEGLSKNNDTVSLANVFKADDNETLKAVGTTDTLAYGETVEVVTEVYRIKENAADPTDGELVCQQTDRIDNLLYSTIELENPVELEKGEYFSIVQTMKYVSGSGDSDTFLLPLEFGTTEPLYVEGYEPGVYYYLEQKAFCHEGESYIYCSIKDGQEPEWMDMASDDVQEFFTVPLNDGTASDRYTTAGNAMIKAFTVDTETTLSLNNEKLSVICYDREGKEITKLDDIDINSPLTVPWNTETVAFNLTKRSATSLTVTFNGKVFDAGEYISKDIFEQADGILTLNGLDRGEKSTRDYNIRILIADKTTDRSELAAALENAEKISKDKYTDDSWQALQNAIAEAKIVMDKQDATQEEIDEQVDALNEAIKGLVQKKDEVILQITDKDQNKEIMSSDNAEHNVSNVLTSTGDDMPIKYLLIVMLAALVMIGVSVFWKKRK